MQLFVTTVHCTSKLHCKTCRNKDGGRNWRQSLSKNFELPDNNVDFECPYGLQWGTQPPVKNSPEDCPDCIREKPKLSHIQPQVVETPKTISEETATPEKVRSGTRNRGGCGCGRR